MLKHPRSNGEPLTHRAYLDACAAQAAAGRPPLRPWVQVRKRLGGTPAVLCGRVVELDAGTSDGEWFKVETDVDPLWIESRNVRLCSGDGRCTCEAEERERAERQRGCPAPGTATRCETSRLEIGQACSIAALAIDART